MVVFDIMEKVFVFFCLLCFFFSFSHPMYIGFSLNRLVNKITYSTLFFVLFLF